MALNIKNPEADRLARELAKRTGESLTQTVIKALRERLRREAAKAPLSLKNEIMAISRRAAALPRRTRRQADEITGYDERGVPR
jgi:antitoxin VapB